jgi:hypothetical protein
MEIPGPNGNSMAKIDNDSECLPTEQLSFAKPMTLSPERAKHSVFEDAG